MSQFREIVHYLIYFNGNCLFITDSNTTICTSYTGLFKYLSMTSDVINDTEGKDMELSGSLGMSILWGFPQDFLWV